MLIKIASVFSEKNIGREPRSRLNCFSLFTQSRYIHFGMIA